MVAKKTKAQNPVMPTATNPVMPPATDTKDMLSEDALDKVTGGVSRHRNHNVCGCTLSQTLSSLPKTPRAQVIKAAGN